MARTVIIVLSFLIILVPVFSIDSSAANDPEIEVKVDALLKPVLNLDLISGTVLIGKNGQIIFCKGYGPANREYDIPNEPDTKFRIGSMTKQFTAAAVLILQERGLLTAGDPIGLYYPEFPRADEITIHHLLTHTSGIINYNNLKDYYEKQLLPLTIDEVIDLVQSESLLFEPGEDFSYSNTGYVILAGIIEKVSGKSYADFLTENIFEPLNMSGTGQDAHYKILKKRADGYVSFGEEIVGTLYRDMPFTSGAGSLYSTALDLFRWDQALYTDILLSKESRERMFTPNLGNYGYGWFIEDKFGRQLISHQGAINGFMGNIDRFVDDSLVIISLFNYQSTFTRAANRALAAIALGEPYEPLLVENPIKMSIDILQQYIGQYQLNVGVVFEAKIVDRQMLLVDDEGIEHECLAQSETKFFIRDMNAMIGFQPDREGNFNRMIILQGANMYRGAKI